MKDTIGIIGGADGPTAIMVAGDFRGIALLAAGIVLILVILLVWYRKKH